MAIYIRMDGVNLSIVKTIEYLGSYINENDRLDPEMNKRYLEIAS